jgi:hypothetical protein
MRTLSYTPAADANGEVTITVTANDGQAANNTFSRTFKITVIAVNDPPTFNAIADQTVNEDAGPQTVQICGVSPGPAYDAGQTVTMTAVSSNPAIVPHPTISGSGTMRTLSYTPAADANGEVTVTVTANDGQATNNTFSRTFKIIVTAVNDAPVAVNDAYTTNEDTPLIVVTPGVLANDSDVDSPTLTSILVTGPTHAQSFTLNADGSFNYTPVANYNGPDSFTYKVNDGSLNSNVATVTVNVVAVNDAPEITIVAGPVAPMPKNNSATITATFTDVDTSDTHTCTISWDDETTTSGIISESNGSGTCTASHTYTAAGVYEPKVTVKDASGSASKTWQYVVVYDTNAGFVTGGGWINSPTGAYTANPSLTGKANFGFVSKYKAGQSIPTGETEFNFSVANFNFHSTVYEWLVVSGPLAQYKGSGTINNAGDYGFLLTATDGQANGGGGTDKFRIKIWRKSDSVVVYDNRLGTSDDINSADPQALGGGSIVIHK